MFDVHKMHACLMCLRCSHEHHGVYTVMFMPDVCSMFTRCMPARCVYDVHKNIMECIRSCACLMCVRCSQDACMHARCVYDVHKNIMECIRSGACLTCVRCSQDACLMCVRCSQDACMPDVCTKFTRTSWSVYGPVHV